MRALQIVAVLGVVLVVGCSGSTTSSAADVGGFDAGPELSTGQDPCALFVEKVCGEMTDAGWCRTSLDCDNARLLATYERERCSERLVDPRWIDCADRPPPHGSACDELVLKCCGAGVDGGGACSGEEACMNARSVEGGGTESDCAQALGDPTLFPACPG